VSSEPAQGILRFSRTELPYPSLDEMIELHERIGRTFDRLGRDRHVLLVDLRRGPLNNKPDFETAMARGRAILVRGFPRVAVLVQTAVGMLQVRRHLREDGIPGDVFTDEAEALSYLARADFDHAPPSGVSRTPDGPFGHLARRAGKR
jgi:hypothetical protein